MKTILVFVTTLDGKVTKWFDPHIWQWSSKEDQAYFKQIWKDYKLFIMGSGTFNFDPVKPNPDYLLTIMTHEPEKYEQYVTKGQVEFTSESAKEISERFKKQGYETMVVVGGPHIATAFLKEQLIDEVWLTLEPKIFGTGGNFVIEEPLDVNLKQLSCEKVNEQGTMITKYAVVKKEMAHPNVL